MGHLLIDLDYSAIVASVLKRDDYHIQFVLVTAGIVILILLFHYSYELCYSICCQSTTAIQPLDSTLLDFVAPNRSIWPSSSYANFLVHGKPIPLHILLTDLFLGKLILRGSPSESLWQLVRNSECTWSIALLAAFILPTSDRPKIQKRVRLTPEMRQAFTLKHSLLAQYLCLQDSEPCIAISGSPLFAKFLFKYYDIQNALDDAATERYRKAVLVLSYSFATDFLTSALDAITAGGFVMLELTIVQKRCPAAVWYTHFSRRFIDPMAISMLVNSCQSVQRFLCRRGVAVDSIVDVSFEEAKICKATCENSRGAYQIWNAWTTILLAEGIIKRFVLLGHKM
ncbi:hypothetical protein V1525DRAFT_395515 [Lipomyces kononenkoae]|uniref:Uncharacterized protein n=1 Tax=Lipomyces kononenkoae TaxID=34357 RepID=A0ACC3T8N7_LIPKO